MGYVKVRKIILLTRLLCKYSEKEFKQQIIIMSRITMVQNSRDSPNYYMQRTTKAVLKKINVVNLKIIN